MAKVTDPTFTAGRISRTYSADINTWDTAAKTLFTIPAGSIITAGRIIGHAAASNTTTASIAVGISGLAGTEYINQYDVRNAQGSNYNASPAWTNFGAQNSNWAGVVGGPLTVGSNAIAVTGKFTSVGGTVSGGPWTIVFDVLPI